MSTKTVEQHEAPSSIFTVRVDAHFAEQGAKLVADAQVATSPTYQRHFSRSQNEIIRAIEGMKGTALVFGAGACHDIPLAELAGRFKQVVLLDADLNATKKAVASLPQDLQKKVTLEQADLTGIFEEFGTAAQKIAEERLPYDAFVSKILDMLPRLQRKGFDYQKLHPSFLCSSLVCSQLPGEAVRYLDKLSREFYGKRFAPPPEREAEFNRWLTELQTGHLDELHRLSYPDGKIYFADHFTAKGIVHVVSEIEEAAFEMGENYFQGSEKVEAYVRSLFAKSSELKWGWPIPVNRSEGTATVEEKDGSTRIIPTKYVEYREYQVSSLNLTPLKV